MTSTPNPTAHFGGKLTWIDKRGARTVIEPGHAACGRQTGHSTRQAALVTCGSCRQLMQKCDARLSW